MGDHFGAGPVLVTGSGGFVGGHVVRHLSRDPARSIIAATRDGRGGSRRLDLRDTAGLAAGLAGVAAVVHCAVGDRAVTVDGTRALLAAARAAGVRRFVHISSVAVYGDASGPLPESSPMVASGHGYAAWKAAAERACLAQDGLEVVRLRPAIVYGPGSAMWVRDLARRIRSGRWGTFGAAGGGTCNLVHVTDVASAVDRALTAAGAAGGVYNISGVERTDWNGWFQRLAAAIGAPALVPLSPAVLKARSLAALPLKALRRVRPGIASDWLLGAPAGSELALFALHVTYPIGAARQGLGWEPQVGLDEGLADSARWLQEQGLAA